MFRRKTLRQRIAATNPRSEWLRNYVRAGEEDEPTGSAWLRVASLLILALLAAGLACACCGCLANSGQVASPSRSVAVATSQPVEVNQDAAALIAKIDSLESLLKAVFKVDIKGTAKLAGDDAQTEIRGSGNRVVNVQSGGWGSYARQVLTGAGAFAAGWILPSCWPLRRNRRAAKVG